MNKKIINLESDSEQVVQIEKPVINQRIVPVEMKKQGVKEGKQILFHYEGSSKFWSFDTRVREFSDFLECFDDQEEQNSDMTVTIPLSLQVSQQSFDLIQAFYSQHQFSSSTMDIRKLTIEGLKKSIDPASLSYLNSSLSPLLSENLRRLFDLCEYLKLNHLKKLVGVYIASRNFFNFNDRTMQQKLQERGAYFSRGEQISLSNKLRPYAQQLGCDLLEQLKNKYENLYNSTV